MKKDWLEKSKTCGMSGLLLVFLIVASACSDRASSPSKAGTSSENGVKTAKTTVSGTNGKETLNTSEIEMVRIEPGSFKMGTVLPGRYSTPMERPHPVVLEKPFRMAKSEVTQGQWKAVMGSNPSRFTQCGDRCPVESVTWFEAIDFCNRLSKKQGLSVCYEGKGELTKLVPDCEGYRLPTEEEWEYAARAGTKALFYTGNCLGADQANFNATFAVPHCEKGVYREKTVEVGGFPPNPWGLFDISGNVQEWTWDRYLPYPKEGEEQDDTLILSAHRTVRGCGWRNGMGACRLAVREGYTPVYRSDNIGLRLARSAN